MTEDMSRYPLRLEGDDVPMVRFRNVTKRYGPLVVLTSSTSTSRPEKW